MSTDFRALCAELADTLECVLDSPDPHCLALIARAHAALAEDPVGPTDEELIGPITWMIDDCIYDNDKGEIAQSLRELIASWGIPANIIREENLDD
jgi:hypothetical protein